MASIRLAICYESARVEITGPQLHTVAVVDRGTLLTPEQPVNLGQRQQRRDRRHVRRLGTTGIRVKSADLCVCVRAHSPSGRGRGQNDSPGNGRAARTLSAVLPIMLTAVIFFPASAALVFVRCVPVCATRPSKSAHTPAHAPTNPAGVLLHGLRGAVVRILRPRCQHAALENEGADKMDY